MRLKVLLAFGVILIVTLALGIFAMERLGVVNSADRAVREKWLPATQTVAEMSLAFEQYRIAEGRALVAVSAEASQVVESDLRQRSQEVDRQLAAYETNFATDDDRAIVGGFRQYWSECMAASRETMGFVRQGARDRAALIYNGKARTPVANARQSAADLMAYNIRGGGRAALSSAAIYVSARIWILAALGGAVLLCGFASYVVIAGVSRPLLAMAGAMQRLVDGDEGVSIAGAGRKDEFGRMAAALEVFRANAIEKRRLAEVLEREADDLRERARIAAEANRAKTAFLAMMSHEIRTPMNAVLGLADVLLNDDLSEPQSRTVSVIRESGELLLRILNDILDYSKLEAGRLSFEAMPFCPATLTNEAASVYGPEALAKGLVLRADTDPELARPLIGDGGRIRQVLMNLVSNAVKFTDAGTVAIEARCLGRQDGAVSVLWEVRDTGIGIPGDKLARLFDEFVQADDSITRRYGGTGLGLAISRRIVEQMGGRIEVESEPGVGSVFRFRLLLPQADGPSVPAAARRDEAAALRAALQLLGRPARLLLAEDNPTNQYVVVQLLRRFDMVVDVAADGQAAVAATLARPYDAVLMDMSMPKMDGLQATRAIRRQGGDAATMPIIALTANAFAHDVKACRAAGMTHFLAKPVASDLLFQTLENALSRAKGGPCAATPAVAAPPAAEEAVVDGDALDVLRAALGGETVRRMIEIFCAETEARLARFAEGRRDPATLPSELHALKGSAATVGALRLAQLAAAAEEKLNGGSASQEIGLADIVEAYHAFRAGIAAYGAEPVVAA
jgi:signal transduction histidine kinase/DNA-binding response OmpR family regulator